MISIMGSSGCDKTMLLNSLPGLDDITSEQERMTPTARLAALYAEYDGLLDALEAVERALHSKRSYHLCARRKLQKERYALCEALADVHEKIADYDFVAR